MNEQENKNYHKAVAQGFMNHMIVAGGANEKQAAELFKRSAQKATALLQKKAAIREAILSEVKGAAAEGLAPNLGKALSGS
jgi:hypothetical protein